MNLSYCMIVKNEAEGLRKNLEAAERFVDEIVIVDTGSDDGTVEIAREFADKLAQIEWPDSFSEARNVSLGMAEGDYIMYLDGDEVIPDESHWHNIRMCLEEEVPDALAIQVENALPSKQMLERDRVWEVRIFRNHPDVRFRGRVHNQITPAIKENPMNEEPKVMRVEAVAYHEGYDRTPEAMEEKYSQRIPLIRKEIEDADGGNWEAYYRYQLVNGLFMLNKHEEAHKELQDIEYEELTNENKYSIYLMAVHLCLNMNEFEEAGKYATAMLEMWGQEPLSYLMKGMVELRLERNNAAMSFIMAAMHLSQARDNVRYDIDPHYAASAAGEAAYKMEAWGKAKNFFQAYLEKYDDPKIAQLEQSIVPRSEVQPETPEGQEEPIRPPLQNR